MRRSRAGGGKSTADTFAELQGEVGTTHSGSGDEEYLEPRYPRREAEPGGGPPPRAPATDPLTAPSMGSYERVASRVFRVDVEAEYDYLERALKLDRAHAADYSELVDALDEATDNAWRAARLHLHARLSLEAYELDRRIVEGDMRAQALADLEREKESGSRKKQITDGDVEAQMAAKFTDQWRAGRLERERNKRTVDALERLSDLWVKRIGTLDAMVRGARRN